jgi:hypothetical protein
LASDDAVVLADEGGRHRKLHAVGFHSQRRKEVMDGLRGASCA